MTYSAFRSSGIIVLSLLFLFLFSITDVFGLIREQPEVYTPSPYSQNPLNKANANRSSQLKIIGVMVEFRPDTNRFTSGNGTFDTGSIPYLETPGTNIDPLPHNQQYFEAHLEFSKNYFETVSEGQVSIDFKVLPDVYTLDYPMADYSPIGENPDISQMVNLIQDVWMRVGQDGDLLIDASPADNIAFVIFHAGVGRDIELTGTTLDKTPQDLPSVYVSKSAISNYIDDPSFSGFPIQNGEILVDNSLIVPRTLTRAGEDVAGNRYVLPLSVNGLLTAQIGSHLGLPDLFNTKTGQSGIGRFGLMDGAGIFAYNGLFPPEPSAWEKVFMGWESPFTVHYDIDELISLPAGSLHEDQSIAKIPVSANEYFLVENRHRQPDDAGVTLTIKKSDGTYVEQTFSNNDVAFTNQESGFDDQLEPGVVVSTSNYDFALPGGLGSSDQGDIELNGGILIWHIDEGIIQSKINRGGINDDPERKGVNLQEADGAQDIGRPTAIGFTQNEVNGSPFDFWWAGNTAQVITEADTIQFYENRFGPDTRPDNSSNSGAPSYFELYDFSGNQPVSTFKIRPVNPYSNLYEVWDSKSGIGISTFTDPEDEYWQRFPLAIQPLSDENAEWILIPGGDGIRFYHLNNKNFTPSILTLSTLQQPFINSTGNQLAIAENPLNTDDFSIGIYRFEMGEIHIDSTYETQSNTAFISSYEPGILDLDGTPSRIDLNEETVIPTHDDIQYSDRSGDYQSRIENNLLILEFPGGSESFSIGNESEFHRAYTGIVQDETGKFIFYLLEDGRLSLFLPADQYQTQRFIHESEFIDWPAFGDFNGNGKPDILFVDKTANQIIAKNSNGAFLSSFPITAPPGVTFSGTPLIADFDGNEVNDLLVIGIDSYSVNLFLYNENGELLNGFPILVGSIEEVNNQPVHPLITGKKLVAVSPAGDLKIWRFDSIQNIQWRSKYGNQTRNKISGFIDFGQPPGQQFSLLNKDETYNWPNPAHHETQLRYQTSKPAEIQLKIMTMSGRLIGKHTFQSRGGVPEEFLLDTSSWASGGYFALIEAKAGGITERKLIKIAVVK